MMKEFYHQHVGKYRIYERNQVEHVFTTQCHRRKVVISRSTHTRTKQCYFNKSFLCLSSVAKQFSTQSFVKITKVILCTMCMILFAVNDRFSPLISTTKIKTLKFPELIIKKASLENFTLIRHTKSKRVCSFVLFV